MTRFANQLNSYTRTRHALYARLLPAFMLMFVTVGLAQAAEVTPITTCPVPPIDTPGEYRLAVDCTVASGAALSIQPTADGVDLNLDGHTISGPRTNSDQCGLADDPARGNTGIFVEASNVHIHGGTVKGLDRGILLFNVTGSRLSGLTVTGNCTGIAVDNSHHSHITGNNVSRNFDNGVGVGRGSTGNQFYGNLVNGNSRGRVSRGFELGDSDGNVITSNVISRNGTGVDLGSGSDNNTIHSNTINGSTAGSGIRVVAASDRNTISGNTANNNFDDGILINSAAGNIIRDNTANNNNRGGITILGTDNIVRGNTANGNGKTANDNDRGIRLGDARNNVVDGRDNVVEGNTALHNIPLDVEDQNRPADPCPNIWMDNTFDMEGNDSAGCVQ